MQLQQIIYTALFNPFLGRLNVSDTLCRHASSGLKTQVFNWCLNRALMKIGFSAGQKVNSSPRTLKTVLEVIMFLCLNPKTEVNVGWKGQFKSKEV